MKKLIIYIVFILNGTLVFSQESDSVNYLIKNPKIHISGFGGIIAETGSFNGNLSECMGVAGALSINHYFFLGAYGVSLISKHTYKDLILHGEIDSMYYFGKSLRINFNHTGIYTGAVFFPKKNIHLGVNLKVGWGNLHLTDSINNSYYKNNNARLEFTNDKVVVLTPQVDVEFAVTDWMKCTIGAGYRIVTGVGSSNFNNFKDFKLNTPQISVGLFFGGFFEKIPRPEATNDSNEEL